MSESTPEPVSSGYVIADRDVVEEFFYPGSTVKGQRVVAVAGQVVPESAMSPQPPKLTATDRQVLKSGKIDPDAYDPASDPNGLIAGVHAGNLETYRGDQQPVQQYDAGGVAVTDPSGVIPPEGLAPSDEHSGDPLVSPNGDEDARNAAARAEAEQAKVPTGAEADDKTTQAEKDEAKASQESDATGQTSAEDKAEKPAEPEDKAEKPAEPGDKPAVRARKTTVAPRGK